MIEIRSNCENCNNKLAPISDEAMICAFECTFCKDCVSTILQYVCPNCGGGFEKRPVLRKEYLSKYPPSEKTIYKPIDEIKFAAQLDRFKDIKPSARE
ncbi:MAG: hypothetical protein ACI9P5_003974 [Saprospiraceae bacterium]|jgi:hypothetical protein|tara:strand:- start:531 stop:824 length:294 start_codon:yes stop_codon:yes gene_type:complete